MKIIGISDIHGNLINIPKCDVLCIAGDVINLKDQRDLIKSEYWWKTKFLTWIMKQPCDRVLVVPGNHDFYLEQLYKEDKWIEFCDYMAIVTQGKLHFLIDQSYEYEEISFYGTPWIHPITFQENKWAFEIKDYKEDNPYSRIPKCDVLITHDSPFENKQLNLTTKNKCRYHLFGHWHEGYYEPLKGKYNCSRLNDYYSFKKNFVYPTINVEPMEKTKYEILQEFAEEVKELTKPYFNTSEAFADVNAFTEFSSKVDELLVKFLDNPRDKEDEISWNESSIIDDDFGTDEPNIDDEYK